ncbi:hypothetical protein KY289_013296 [Solanum tuberosum]|nr:hypothetical protein KY289_013296 [Solanum tuberosum]
MSDRVPAINAVDSSHAFYIHPSHYPEINLVSTVFYGRSYGGWRRAVIIALSAKNNLGFIDGSLVVPTDITLQKSWSRCNDMILSWLFSSLSKEIDESILYSQSAKVLWSDLEDRFGQANGVRSNILLSSPLPTIGQAYSLVIQDEKQREFMLLLLRRISILSCWRKYSQGVENDPDVNSLSQENVAQLLQKLNLKNDGSTNASANLTCAGPFTEEASGAW